MNDRRERKNDFFYAAVVFAMFAVVVFNVVAAYVEFHPDAYFAEARVAVRPAYESR